MIQIKSDNGCFSDTRFPNDGVVVPCEMIPPLFLPWVKERSADRNHLAQSPLYLTYGDYNLGKQMPDCPFRSYRQLTEEKHVQCEMLLLAAIDASGSIRSDGLRATLPLPSTPLPQGMPLRFPAEQMKCLRPN